MSYFLFQGPISHAMKTIVKIRWSFAQIGCAVYLLCPSNMSHGTCQFRVLSGPKTIKSPTKCDVHAANRSLYSEQTTRNVVIRHCTSSWQCSAAQCSCNKEVPAAFLMGRFDHPPYNPDLATSDFHLFPCMKLCLRGQHFGNDNELQTSIENWLKAQAAGFHDKCIGKLVTCYEKCLHWIGDYVEKYLVGVAKCCKYNISDFHCGFNVLIDWTLKKMPMYKLK